MPQAPRRSCSDAVSGVLRNSFFVLAGVCIQCYFEIYRGACVRMRTGVQRSPDTDGSSRSIDRRVGSLNPGRTIVPGAGAGWLTWTARVATHPDGTVLRRVFRRCIAVSCGRAVLRRPWRGPAVVVV